MKASFALATTVAALFAIVAPSQADSSPLVHLDKRIIAGTVVESGKYPFAVRLNIQRGVDEYLCGGSLLLDNCVVTAAHCLVDTDTNAIAEPHTVSVCYGSNNVLEQTCTPALNVTVHRRYNSDTISNDIALLQIKPLTLKTGSVETVPVYTGQLAEKQTLTTMGWGKTSNNSTALPSTLMSVDIEIGTAKSCRVANPDYSTPNGPEVCSSNALTPGKDSCQGDSGSPTIVSVDGVVYLAALTSSGTDPKNPGSADCATSDGLAFYTHVNYFMSFIALTTGKPPSSFTGSQKSSSTTTGSDSGPFATTSSNNDNNNSAAGSTISGTATVLSSLAMAIILTFSI
ncbi:hypothetical protein IW146_005594 [Coemansia sp. RSA 922]|nr:hypothetical protein GGI14_001988 [Coemansia sp. S680]KAJ2034084.1 hypothetical protein H4S03_005221 [Coemansia sp. S3946]KAJ2047120.1 hypothetical protein H4S04_004636 [Coemansia sp. S16]KAJ2064835.1 hypothetical protein GGI08_002320 [Coemansia sp. S2]KAJ2070718.1 hypothetical protein GGH13_003838 [Coemansia sp. S155-1]KAJ2108410.1 hypothetical protein GGI16_001146 [Coemansia sp. S142-1]KAJ2111117.1 hypothetical protein IW146_005594 [Coemansia sp. RSA 922]